MGDEAKQPLTILLVGFAALAMYIAFRPWPVTPQKKPIRPAAYVHDILGGHPPSGPPASQDTDAIEAGLWAVLGIWAVSKAAETAGSLGQAAAGAAGLGAALGSAFKWIKGKIGDLGKVAGDVPIE